MDIPTRLAGAGALSETPVVFPFAPSVERLTRVWSFMLSSAAQINIKQTNKLALSDSNHLTVILDQQQGPIFKLTPKDKI